MFHRIAPLDMDEREFGWARIFHPLKSIATYANPHSAVCHHDDLSMARFYSVLARGILKRRSFIEWNSTLQVFVARCECNEATE